MFLPIRSRVLVYQILMICLHFGTSETCLMPSSFFGFPFAEKADCLLVPGVAFRSSLSSVSENLIGDETSI